MLTVGIEGTIIRERKEEIEGFCNEMIKAKISD